MKADLGSVINLGKHAFKEGDLPRAQRLFEEAIGKGADFADLHHSLGLIHHQHGDAEKAEACFRRSLEINPAYTEALLSLSIVLNESGRYDEGADAYRRAQDSLPRPEDLSTGGLAKGRIANLHAELAEVYLAIGKTAEAVREYRHALDIAPEFHDLRLRLSAALREAGRTEDALEEAERVLRARPASVAAMMQRGTLLYLLGRRDQARKSWEEALFREPSNRLVQLYLHTLDREEREAKGQG